MRRCRVHATFPCWCWIELLDLSKLLCGFVKVVTLCVKVVTCISGPMPNKTKLKSDQDFEWCWIELLLYGLWICQNQYMDFSKLLHGSVRIDAWISLSCYIDMSKMLNVFVEVGFVKVVLVFLALWCWSSQSTQCLGPAVPLVMCIMSLSHTYKYHNFHFPFLKPCQINMWTISWVELFLGVNFFV